MTQEDKIALKEFLIGSAIAIGITVVFLLLVFASGIITTEEKPITPSNKFEVVDKYKNCDLIRWTDSGLAEYKYFLYCPL